MGSVGLDEGVYGVILLLHDLPPPCPCSIVMIWNWTILLRIFLCAVDEM